jgi:hypothetical protein
MKIAKSSEFMFELFALIVIAIIVQGFYATAVRPKAESIRANDAAQMQKDPNYVPKRELFVIIKDYEQEVCFILTFW